MNDDAGVQCNAAHNTSNYIQHHSMCQCVNVLVVGVRYAFENSVKEQRTPINYDDDDDDNDNDDDDDIDDAIRTTFIQWC